MMIIKTIIGSKNKYLMRSYEDLKVDMKRLALEFNTLYKSLRILLMAFFENVVAMYWIFLIMNTSLYKY